KKYSDYSEPRLTTLSYICPYRTHFRSGHQQHAGEHRREHRGAAEVGFDRGEQHRRRGDGEGAQNVAGFEPPLREAGEIAGEKQRDRKSTRLNSSHVKIS